MFCLASEIIFILIEDVIQGHSGQLSSGSECQLRVNSVGGVQWYTVAMWHGPGSGHTPGHTAGLRPGESLREHGLSSRQHQHSTQQ